jgi:predicted Zn-dependent protease with MMP-like domain
MQDISDEQFHELMNDAMASLPKSHIEKIKNVALLLEDDVSEETRQKMNLAPGTTLLGLYQGIPLARRQGMQTTLPDTITLYKWPLMRHAHDLHSLKEQIRHTLWHEIAHYYGLDHPAIHELE